MPAPVPVVICQRTGGECLCRDLAHDPALERGAALDAHDDRILRLRPGVVAAVVQRLGVDDHLLVAGQRDPDPSLAVELGWAYDEHAGGVVGQLQPHPRDPPIGRRVAWLLLSRCSPQRHSLGEFGDDPHRHASAKARKDCADASPLTARPARRRSRWPGSSATTGSPTRCPAGAKRPDRLTRCPGLLRRDRGLDHDVALRALSDRPVGILHGCLKTGTVDDEATAWSHRVTLPDAS